MAGGGVGRKCVVIGVATARKPFLFILLLRHNALPAIPPYHDFHGSLCSFSGARARTRFGSGRCARVPARAAALRSWRAYGLYQTLTCYNALRAPHFGCISPSSSAVCHFSTITLFQLRLLCCCQHAFSAVPYMSIALLRLSLLCRSMACDTRAARGCHRTGCCRRLFTSSTTDAQGKRCALSAKTCRAILLLISWFVRSQIPTISGRRTDRAHEQASV